MEKGWHTSSSVGVSSLHVYCLFPLDIGAAIYNCCSALKGLSHVPSFPRVYISIGFLMIGID